MDHGDLLRECRLMLHAISSQISILVAGLQRLEGQQRHPQRLLRHQHLTGNPGHIGPTNLSNGAHHACGHFRQPDGTSRTR